MDGYSSNCCWPVVVVECFASNIVGTLFRRRPDHAARTCHCGVESVRNGRCDQLNGRWQCREVATEGYRVLVCGVANCDVYEAFSMQPDQSEFEDTYAVAQRSAQGGPTGPPIVPTSGQPPWRELTLRVQEESRL